MDKDILNQVREKIIENSALPTITKFNALVDTVIQYLKDNEYRLKYAVYGGLSIDTLTNNVKTGKLKDIDVMIADREEGDELIQEKSDYGLDFNSKNLFILFANDVADMIHKTMNMEVRVVSSMTGTTRRVFATYSKRDAILDVSPGHKFQMKDRIKIDGLWYSSPYTSLTDQLRNITIDLFEFINRVEKSSRRAHYLYDFIASGGGDVVEGGAKKKSKKGRKKKDKEDEGEGEKKKSKEGKLFSEILDKYINDGYILISGRELLKQMSGINEDWLNEYDDVYMCCDYSIVDDVINNDIDFVIRFRTYWHSPILLEIKDGGDGKKYKIMFFNSLGGTMCQNIDGKLYGSYSSALFTLMTEYFFDCGIKPKIEIFDTKLFKENCDNEYIFIKEMEYEEYKRSVLWKSKISSSAYKKINHKPFQVKTYITGEDFGFDVNNITFTLSTELTKEEL